jgi:hypothetical protein
MQGLVKLSYSRVPKTKTRYINIAGYLPRNYTTRAPEELSHQLQHPNT